jgi:hypothetical protein
MLAAAPIAHAQDAASTVSKPAAAPAQDGAIVVNGKAQKPVARAQHFVGQVLDLTSGQLARFIDPICLEVVGLPPRFKGPIEDRIRLVATAAQVRLSTKEKCDPNLIVAFVEDGDTLIKDMRKRRNKVFDQLDDGALHDAFKAGPIHAWRLVATRDEMGNYTNDSSSDPDNPPVMEGDTQAVTVNAVITLDRKVILGKTVKQIGDYIVMRTMVGAKPPEKGSIKVESILSLFDPAVTPPPVEISDMDLGLLAGLYHMRDPSADGRDQAWRISRAMVSGKQR